MFLALLLACVGGAEDVDDSGLPGGDTGQDTDPGGGGADAPAYCAEVSREQVMDRTVPAEPLDFSAQAVLDAVLGGWPGTFSPHAGEAAPMNLTFAWESGPIEVVVRELVDPAGGDTGPAPGAPSADCPPFYALDLFGGLAVDGGLLDEHYELALEAPAADAASFLASVDHADMQGTARPTSFDPDDWATTELSIVASLAGGTWEGSTLWLGSNETAASEADGGGTGTVEPSGVVEGLGSFTATR